MKLTSQSFTVIACLLVGLLSFTTWAQVGINTTSPTETLHVNGNTRIDGALMPGNDAGTTDQILISKGSGNPAEWGPALLNINEISNIGKFYTGLFNSNNGTVLALTITDPNMTADSVVTFNFVGPLPVGPQYGNNFRVFVEPRNGEVVFYITNATGGNFTNLEIAYVSFYH